MRFPPTERTVLFWIAGMFGGASAAALLWLRDGTGAITTFGTSIMVGCLVGLGAMVGTAFHRASIELERAKVALQARTAESERLQSKIAEGSNSRGRLFANIAHEIKTPLAIVVGQTDLLLLNIDDPAAIRSHAKSISEEIRHLSRLVDSFLRLSRPLLQEDTSHHEPVFVHDFVIEVVRRCRFLSHESGVSIVPILTESLDDGPALEVFGDSGLLEAMLENLVRNAVRFSPRGASVEVRVRAVGESVVISVRDQGQGIAPEHLESIFDWFFRGPGLPLKNSGTGFGLAIAKRIADHHRGTLHVRNHPEGGCEFEITLPLWVGEELEAERTRA